MNPLYHYCTPSTFASIVSTKSIWLSSMSLSNDSMEGKILSETFARIFEKDEIDKIVLFRLKMTFSAVEEMLDGLAFCLSANGDLLSQWRGYAADGAGFSIGFSKEYLEALAGCKNRNMEEFRLHKVIYREDEQESAIRPVYEEIKKEVDLGVLQLPVKPGLGTVLIDPTAMEKYRTQTDEFNAAYLKVSHNLAKSFRNLYTLKHDAFEEEKEWRLISFLTTTGDDHCSYRVAGDRLIPYRPYELLSLNMPEIVEVVLGPKNQTPEFVVKRMLSQYGFSGVEVRRSRATYR